MERREFLIRTGQTIIAIPMVLTAVSCGDDNPTEPANNPSDFNVTSSNNAAHTHRVTFTCADLSSGTLNYTSTNDGAHTHDITLGMDDPAKILNGETVTVTSTVDNGHSHTWQILKPASTCT